MNAKHVYLATFGLSLFGSMAITNLWVKIPLAIVAGMSAARAYTLGKREDDEQFFDLTETKEEVPVMGVKDEELIGLSDEMATAVIGLRKIADHMQDPHEEFSAVAFIATDKQTVMVPVSEFLLEPDAWNVIHPELELPEGKTPKDGLLEAVLPGLVMHEKGREVVLVVPAWLSVQDCPIEDVIPPSEDADRVEVVLVQQVTPKGLRVFYAPVGRDPIGNTPPTLAEFEEIPQGEGTHAVGDRSSLSQVLASLRLVALAEIMGVDPMTIGTDKEES